MNGRTAAKPAAIAPAKAVAPRRRGGKLFRKYVLLFVALVGGTLLASGALEVWFSYQENKEALARIQHEKALAAAARIEQFIDEIMRQIGWTTRAQWSRTVLEQRRFEYLQLLRQAPAVTEVSHLDAQGREELRVSRLAMDVIGSNTDYSDDPKFTEAKARKTWFSPVYFRKESEPYITLAIAGTGRDTGVTVAEVNLKFIWDVISRIKVGQAGYAYVVDTRGLLIAHPDIGLVLRKTDLSALPQVAEALADPGTAASDGQALVGVDSGGRQVLTAHAGIAPLDWTVFVDLPLSEAFAPLYASLQRTAAFMLLGLALAVGAGMLLARRMVVPIQALQSGAARIGAGDLDHRIAIKTGDEVEGLADQFNRMTAQLAELYAGLERKVEERTRELREALEQQTATAEVLRVIASSPGKLEFVLQTVAENAARLCAVEHVSIMRIEDDRIRHVAAHGTLPRRLHADGVSLPLRRSSAAGRAIIERRAVHISDFSAVRSEYPDSPAQGAPEIRTLLAVPLLREGSAVGAIVVVRTEVRPFSDKQVELLTTFADQSVIAIENARLLDALQARTDELGRSVEELTATSDVLRIIAGSPGDLQPVLNTLVEAAKRVCGGDRAFLFKADGGAFRMAAYSTGWTSKEFLDFLSTATIVPGPGTAAGRTLLEQRTVHILDALNEPGYEWVRFAEQENLRTILSVPLMREGAPIGVITVNRARVQAFTEREIELLTTFADQAVIAIENARLLDALQARTDELGRSVEELTATSDVLRIIARSPKDLQPVLDTLVQTATRLCRAERGFLFRSTVDGYRLSAAVGYTEDERAFMETFSVSPGHGTLVGRTALLRQPVRFSDALNDPTYDWSEVQQRLGYRSTMGVPLMRDGEPIGVFAVVRNHVEPFTDKEVELMTTFADQAVIAIENTRLLDALQARTDELGRSVEELTATSEILRVIASSPGQLEPVLQSVAENAARLCEADEVAIHRIEGDHLQFSASYGTLRRQQVIDQVKIPIVPGAVSGRAVLERRTIHVADITALESEYPDAPAHRLKGVRTLLAVPLLRQGVAIGAIVSLRTEVRPFSEKQIELVTSFADQAVIAIENARLLDALQARTDELGRSVEELTATSDVLRIIARSPGDLQPVLDTLVETAKRVCGADRAMLFRADGALYRLSASSTGWHSQEFMNFFEKNPITPGLGTGAGRTIAERRPVQILDVWSDPNYQLVDFAKHENLRTLLGVPLLREGVPIGVITVNRHQVKAFTAREIELLTTFADQAVIAIENARLLDELKARTDELAQSVDELKALGEVGRAVSATLDLKTVLETIVARAAELGDADACTIFRYRPKERQFKLWHAAGLDPTYAMTVRALDVHADETLMGRAVYAHEPMQIADLSALPNMPLRDASLAAGYHSVLIVPLVRADRVFGALVLNRRERGEFSVGTVNLLRTFANQSILAIQNARLFREIEDKGRQLADRQPAQVAVPRQHEPRAAHAAERHPRLHRAAARRPLRQARREGAGRARARPDQRQAPARPDQRRARPRQDRGGPAHADDQRLFGGRHHPVGRRGDRIAGQGEGAGAEGRSRPGAAARPRRRAAPDAGAAQPRRQCDQVHRQRLRDPDRAGARGHVQAVGARHRARHRRGRPGAHLRGVPAGRQFEHAQEGRHRPGPRHLEADHRDAWRIDRGRVTIGRGCDLPDRSADPGQGRAGGGVMKRILVVEDTEDNRQIMRDLLSNAGYDMIEAQDGAEGVAMAQSHRPDLILMDIQLPVLDGYEATRRIKADPALAHIPVIAVTSYALSGDEAKTKAAGCDGYVAKPFSPRQLLHKVREYLP